MLLLGFSLLFCLGVAEVALRLVGFSYPNFHMTNAVTGAGLAPGVEGWYKGEGEAYVRINSAGLRDEEHTLAKSEDTYRIAILGDSYSEAFQVDIDDAFWSVIERELLKCPALMGRRAESINFGVSGFGTAQQLQVLRHRVWDYSPDLILLAFVSNDVRNNFRILEKDPFRPYFVRPQARLPQNGPAKAPPAVWVDQEELLLDDSFLRNEAFRRLGREGTSFKAVLRDHLRVVQLAYKAKAGWQALRVENTSQRDSDGTYGPPKTAALEEAWSVTEALLATIVRETREGGADFLLAVVSESRQAHPDPKTRAKLAEELGLTDYFYYEDRVLELASRLDFEGVGLSRVIRKAAEERQECLHGFDNVQSCYGHWNELGHAVAGEEIAEAICRLETRKTPALLPPLG